MIVQDILDELKNGEFSLENFGENAEAGFSEYNYDKLISYINSALLEIHTKYPLRIREVLLEQQETITMYKLRSDYCKSNLNSTQPIKYLDDTADPFDDTLLKVDEVYNESGVELPINNMNESASVFTPNLGTLQIPYPVKGAKYSVIYRSAHPRLVNDSTVLTQRIELPLSFLRSIILFIVYKHKLSLNTQQATQDAVMFLGMFNESLRSLDDVGLITSNDLFNNKLELRGWR